MFNGIGVNWAGTLLGLVAVVLIPIPVIFYIYGARIRKRSAFAPDMSQVMAAHGGAPGDEEKNGSTSEDGANLTERRSAGAEAV